MQLRFTKMHGIGNDMILINNLDDEITLAPRQIAHLCDRHFGIGADGLILIEKGQYAGEEQIDFFMNYVNSDGSIGQMCGNGIRCAAKFFIEETSSDKTEIIVGTRSGNKKITLQEVDGATLYAVNMGKPAWQSDKFPPEPKILGGYGLNFISNGPPHAVAFVESVDKIHLEEVGPRIINDQIFPDQINLEIVEQLSANILKMRVWERGSGLTLACGTGACAVFAVAKKLGKIEEKALIQLPGGNLLISENAEGEIIMTGSAEKVFSGEIDI